MAKDEIKKTLRDFKKGKVTETLAIKKIKKATTMDSRDMERALQLCPFSGGSSGESRSKCSRTNAPMTCETCRVAAEWEEAYG